jgi:hypothetical protein
VVLTGGASEVVVRPPCARSDWICGTPDATLPAPWLLVDVAGADAVIDADVVDDDTTGVFQAARVQ